MPDRRAWLFDEFQHIGTDYASPAEVQRYDETHADFRDVTAECDAALAALEVGPGSVVVEFGCGTGAFTVQAAKRGATVYAVDISEAMLQHARHRAEQAGAHAVTFHHAGFLTYEHAGPPADAVHTSLALHHLPDYWKGEALARVFALLKPDGRLHLADVVLPDDGAADAIAAFIAEQARVGGDFLREDAELHFRAEYSTYDWVMQGLLQRVGFTLERTRARDAVLREYLCRRPG